MTKSRLGCLAAALIVALVVSLLLNFGLLARSAQVKSAVLGDLARFRETRVTPGDSGDRIVLIHLNGIISSSIGGALGETMVEDMKLALQQAVEDENVKAVVLAVDSPGGEVTAADAIYHSLVQAREKKPVVVHMGSLAASGGYYVACGGSHVIAHQTTLTGSIGVIIQTLNYQELFGKIGLESVVFKSGKFKDILSGARPMTPEESALIQSLVMEMYDRFVGIVARERSIPEPLLRETIADGRILSGQDAADKKLVDGVGYIEDAYTKARELAGSPDAVVVRYEAPFNLGRLFRVFGEAAASRVEIALPENLMPRLEPGRMYLLPAFYAP